jgi:hypothetical protein
MAGMQHVNKKRDRWVFLRGVGLPWYPPSHPRMSLSDQGSDGGGQHRDDQFSDEETARRRDDTLRRALNTPHKPHRQKPTASPLSKPKERPASKGRVHKGKTRR